MNFISLNMGNGNEPVYVNANKIRYFRQSSIHGNTTIIVFGEDSSSMHSLEVQDTPKQIIERINAIKYREKD